MKTVFSLIFLAIMGSLFPSDADLLAKEAEARFSVGHYANAVMKYKALLGEELSATERAVVLTDIATVMVSEEMWDKAVSYCSRALDIADIPPHVSMHTFYIKALALLESSREGDSDDAVAMAREGLAAAENAREAWRQAAILYGDENNFPPDEYDALYGELKNVLKALLEREHEQWLASLPFGEGRNLLAEHLKKMISKADTFIGATANELVLAHHRNAFVERESSWRPLWKSLQAKVSEKDEASFREAYRHYNSALDSIAGENLQRGRDDLLAAYELLIEESDDGGGGDSDAESEENNDNTGSDDVKVLLQQMDYDDKIRELDKKPIREGQRPW